MSQIFLGIIIGMFLGGKVVAKNVNPRLSNEEKNELKLRCLEQWIKFENRGMKIKDRLLDENLRNIVVYGGTGIGELLIKSIEVEDDLNIVAVMDKNSTLSYDKISVIEPGIVPAGTDCIIVTVVDKFDDIREFLIKENKVKIINFVELIR